MAYHQPFSLAELHDSLDELRVLVDEDDEVVRRKLCELAVDYKPTDGAKNVDAQAPAVAQAEGLPQLAVEGLR